MLPSTNIFMIALTMINFIATFSFLTLQKAAETINPTITYIRHISAINHSLIVILFYKMVE